MNPQGSGRSDLDPGRGRKGQRDPRSRSGFEPAWYPTANGAPAPAPDAVSRNERIELEFLEMYYELNRTATELTGVRRGAPGPERDRAERRVLRRIDRALASRDALEDRYAPLGILAEPVMRDGLAVDVRFTFGDVDDRGRPRSEGYRMSAYAPLPGVSWEGPGVGPERGG
jgi:hypothetical protein